MNKFFAAALLIAGFSFGGVEHGEAAPFAMPGHLNAAVSQTGAGTHLQKTDGWWWAVPLVVGGVILLDRHYRYHHYEYYHPRPYRSYYHGCYRECRRDHGHRHCRNYC